MKRLLVICAIAVTTLAPAVPASAWPPVCKPIIYDTTGECV